MCRLCPTGTSVDPAGTDATPLNYPNTKCIYCKVGYYISNPTFTPGTSICLKCTNGPLNSEGVDATTG